MKRLQKTSFTVHWFSLWKKFCHRGLGCTCCFCAILSINVNSTTGVLEWFYMLTEKILFQNRGLPFSSFFWPNLLDRNLKYQFHRLSLPICKKEVKRSKNKSIIFYSFSFLGCIYSLQRRRPFWWLFRCVFLTDWWRCSFNQLCHTGL